MLALSLTSWLQPGEAHGTVTLNRFNGLIVPEKAVETALIPLFDGGHRAEAAVLMKRTR